MNEPSLIGSLSLTAETTQTPVMKAKKPKAKATRKQGGPRKMPNAHDLEDADTPYLKKIMASFGLKPQAKKAMKAKLTQIWDQLNVNQGSADQETSSRVAQDPHALDSNQGIQAREEGSAKASKRKKKNQADVEAQIRTLIYHHDELYLQVVLFQTLQLSKVLDLLHSSGIKASKPTVMNLLDREGIIFSQATGHSGGGPIRAPRPGRRPAYKRRRAL